MRIIELGFGKEDYNRSAAKVATRANGSVVFNSGVADVDRFGQKNYCYPVKVRDIVRLIEKDGWYWARTKGSHHQYKHPTKPGLVTVPGNPGDDVASGTLNNILKQAGLKP